MALSKTLALLKEQGAVLTGTTQAASSSNPAETRDGGGDAMTLASGVESPQRKEGDSEMNLSDDVKMDGVVEEKLGKENMEMETEGDSNSEKVEFSCRVID